MIFAWSSLKPLFLKVSVGFLLDFELDVHGSDLRTSANDSAYNSATAVVFVSSILFLFISFFFITFCLIMYFEADFLW